MFKGEPRMIADHRLKTDLTNREMRGSPGGTRQQTRLKKRLSALLLALALMISSGIFTTASAATGGIAVTSVNLRAGPSTRYPVVTTLPSSASLKVYGCIADRSWCDISWGNMRGWVSANYIHVVYHGQTTVLTPAIVPVVGIATVAFSVTYWNTHYYAQPWHSQWDRYYGGGSRTVAAGCNDNGCGGAAVTRGPNGGGRAVVGGCGPERCAGASVTRGPRGNTVIRHGSFGRP
jgi:uncharacterized protein YraI